MERESSGFSTWVLILLCIILCGSNFVTYSDMVTYRESGNTLAKQLGVQIEENRELRHKDALVPAEINAALANMANQLRYQTARAQNAEKRVNELRQACYSKGVLVR